MLNLITHRRIPQRIRLIRHQQHDYVLPTSPTDSEVLNYSAQGYTVVQIDAIINQLYSDGYCTNCIIDLKGNSVPTDASSVALAGLRVTNTVIVDQ